MTFETYEEIATSTRTYGAGQAIIYPTLGLNGEAGEVAEKVKKTLRDNAGEFDAPTKEAIANELGDCLWYINALATDLGYTLSDIAQLNIDKIVSRRLRGQIHGNGDNR